MARGSEPYLLEPRARQSKRAKSVTTPATEVFGPRVTRGHDPAGGTLKNGWRPAKLLLQPAANAGELGSVFTNQKRSARPDSLSSALLRSPADRLSGRGDLANKVSGVVQVQNFGRHKKVSY